MLDIFQVKKYLDQKTKGKTRLKKLYFPAGGLEMVALACVEWVKNGLYTLYAVWEDNLSLKHIEILSCQKPFPISKARIIFSWLAIKFFSPQESGIGCNIYDINNLCPGLTETIKSRRNSGITQTPNTCSIPPG